MGELTCYLQVLASLTANVSKLIMPSSNEDEDDGLSDFEVDKSDNIEVSLKEELEVKFKFQFLNVVNIP